MFSLPRPHLPTYAHTYTYSLLANGGGFVADRLQCPQFAYRAHVAAGGQPSRKVLWWRNNEKYIL